MERLQVQNNLGGTLDGTSTFSGWESKGDIQAIDIRVFENVGTSTGELPPPVTADFAQQYRADSTWLNLTPSIDVLSMNSLKLQTKNKPFYLKYRTSNRGKGWLDYVLSTSTTDFAGWKGYPVTALEIQLFANNGTRLFDTHAVMYRSKVAGEWLSWVSNVDLEIMQRLQLENNLGGALDADSTFSGWESKGDIQAIEIRLFENVGASTGELPPASPSEDFEIPHNPNNPNGLRIYIDAGHGGKDSGACNGSYYEKHYTLQLSLLQKQYFEQAGYNVTLSRDVDCFVDNSFKASQANKVNADLYIANHINSVEATSPNGVEVYYQVNPAFTAKGKAVAQKAVANLSTIFNSRGIKTRTQDDGRDYYCVLRETRMPALLIEHGFISNIQDLAKLNDGSNIVAMAKAVVKAVCDTVPNTTKPQDNHKNEYLNWANAESLSSKLETQVKKDIALITDLKSKYSPKQAIDIVLDHDSIITDICNQYKFPKCMVQSILLRESYYFGFEDDVKDSVVMASYYYDKAIEAWLDLPLWQQIITPQPEIVIGYEHDSSTGVGQIFAKTAIKAHNSAVVNGIKGGRVYDIDNLADLKEFWFKLKDDDEFNIEYLCLVLIYEAFNLGYSKEYFNYNDNQIKMVFTKYLGTYSSVSEYSLAKNNLFTIFNEYK